MTEFVKLTKKRGTIKAGLTIFSNYLKDISSKTELSQLEVIKLKDRLNNVENCLSDFNQCQIEIEMHDNINSEEQFAERERFENSYYDAIAFAKDMLKHEDDSHSINSHYQFDGIKLPDISLPKFNGKFEDWLEFRDIYKSLIHENKRLNNMQKFHYLRGALEGTAAASISKIKYTENNYEVAWATITNRFDNNKKLIYEHIKAIFSVETISKPSSEKLQSLADDICKHLGSIEQLGQNTDNWDPLLIFWLSNKLDSVSSIEWDRETKDKDLPTIDQFLTFLQRRANFIDTQEAKVNLNINCQENRNNKIINQFKQKRTGNIKSLISTNSTTCSYCKGEHAIYACEEFLNLSVPQKRDFVRKANLCFNCLRPGHSTKRCKLGPCRECKSWHNTLLHESLKNNKVSPTSNESINAATSLNSSVMAPIAEQILLSTVHILISNQFNTFHKVRALLDCGSQTSFITESLVKRLNLDIQNTDLSVFGISNNISKINKRCKVLVKSINNKFEINCNCYILDVITGAIPSATINIHNWKIPNNLKLADANFFEPGQVDMLLGADIFWSVLGTEKIQLGKNLPILYNTSFGWVVSGAIGGAEQKKASCHLSLNQDLLNAISKFWEIEDFDTKKLAPDEQLCEDNFIQTTIRDNNGRFIVTIPLTQNPSNLGDSRIQAEKRFYALERKFKRNTLLHERYKKFMLEYRSLGHMAISDERDESHFEYFMPHHGVTKEESLTTKLRVVFDASAPSSNGLSFNNIQMVGPVLQDDIFSIILRFRKHNFVISADIAKMYRQILVTPQQRVLQKIFWRDNPDDKLDTYQLNTVTYGQAASSYLAIRCIVNLADEIQETKPDIANIIKHDFYVDDLLTGADNIEYAQYICDEINKTLNSGCFELRKWRSNHAEVLKTVNSGNLDHNILEFSSDNNMKTLGLIWSCKEDKLLYNICHDHRKSKTKRTILSAIAKIFDPLGLLSPCTILAKILMQSLWAGKLAWDEIISGSTLDTWNKFESELCTLNQLQIHRQVLCKNFTEVHLHGFADASQKAYGASIYLSSIDKYNNIRTALLCAKSKVAPIKTITIPRLELCAALLLARLYHKVKISLKINFRSCTLWSDSTITLAWIRTSPHLLKTFTGNRVSEIQILSESAEWRYVSTHDNPADIVSRGLFPSEILNSSLWWFGPSWLSKEKSCWPNCLQTVDVLPDLKANVLVTMSHSALSFPFERFSKLVRMQRTAAYILRFWHNCLKKDSRKIEPLTVEELNNALTYLIRICQNDSFPVEIRRLKSEKSIGSSTSILMLNPFLDSNNILRVGGRLKFSDYPFDKKHPILIHSKHHFTKLLFAHEHQRTFHGGPQLLLSTVRETYWPVSGRNLARSTVKKCLTCFKFAAKSIQPIMANLPRERVNPSSAFSVVGVDYSGPFLIKDKRGRGSHQTKCYIGLFICLSTKAIHLELISSLTCESFIQALYRFVSRRGKPCKILSDNGKNFVGAQRELTNFLSKNGHTITNQISSEGIKWSFIPPYSPHFGGLWESAVKSVKHHLKRIISNVSLLFEEFATILCQIEAILNSRPLSPLSSDPNDLGPLTPAHFLIGRPLIAAPDQDLSDVNINRLSRFQLLQLKSQQFWNRWKLDYISELQRRSKWQTNKKQLTEGSLVLIKGEHTPPTQWLLGRICELHKGPDGIARVASIKTSTGTIKRCFQKICPLPLTA